MRKIFLLSLLVILVLSFSVMAAEEQIEFTFAVDQEMNALDPVLGGGVTGRTVRYNLYDPLVYPDPDPDVVVRPWLAKSWEISDDGLTYTFHLHEGVKFHNGDILTADDVVFSMDRIVSGSVIGEDNGFFEPFLDVGNTVIVDKYTVEFHLNKLNPQFLPSLITFHIVNKDLVMENLADGEYGEYGDYGKKYLSAHDAGSGPYMLLEAKAATNIKMKKFEDYFMGWKKNSIDILNVAVIPEETTRIAMLKAGAIDMVDATLRTTAYDELKEFKGIKVYDRDISLNSWILVLNNKRPPLDDIYVRKALSYAFPYDAINTHIIEGVQAVGPVPKTVTGHTDEEVLTFETDFSKAKEMLKKSKYSEQELKEFTITLINVGSEAGRFNNMNVAIASAFNSVGISTKVQQVPWSKMIGMITDAKTPEEAPYAIPFYESAKIPDCFSLLKWYSKKHWGAAYPNGALYYSEPRIEELMKKANKALDEEKRIEIYKELQREISRDVPAIWFLNDYYKVAMRDYVKGYIYPRGAGDYERAFYWLTIEK